MSPLKVIHISGLGRSGTTITDFILGSFPDTISLGETFPLIRDFGAYWGQADDISCSCGASMRACPFWGEVGPSLIALDDIENRYGLLFDRFSQLFPGKALVDSSGNADKRKRFVFKCLSDERINLKSVFLARDVRGWVNSMKNADRRYWHEGTRRRWVPTWVYFLRWFQRNRAIKSFHERQKIPTLTLGYEPLVLAEAQTMGHLAGFLGFQGNTGIDLSRTESHVITGNRMRLAPQEREALSYDYSWMSKYQLSFWMAAFPFVYRLNKKLVHAPAND